MKLTTGAILILAWVAMLSIATSPSSGQVAESAEVWRAGAYCTDEASAARLSKAMADKGAVGYGVEMMSGGTNCYDVETMGLPYPQVTLLEKQWQIVTLNGQKVDFWTAVDKNGGLGWIWFFIDDGV